MKAFSHIGLKNKKVQGVIDTVNVFLTFLYLATAEKTAFTSTVQDPS
jgi:hypothetical protein